MEKAVWFNQAIMDNNQLSAIHKNGMDDVNNYTGDIQEGWGGGKTRLKFQTIPMSLIDIVIAFNGY